MATVNSYSGCVPTPDRTSLDEIVLAARELLEQDSLTMQAVADRVGVQAPSLYKRVRSRDELVRMVAEATLAELALLDGDLRSIAQAYRDLAHERPAAFRLLFSGVTVSPSLLAAASEPILRASSALAGPDHALVAARTVTAWANGFISMELAGGFNLGGSVDEAWEFGLARLIDAISLKA
jgi:AcrR family transcriptional regulator